LGGTDASPRGAAAEAAAGGGLAAGAGAGLGVDWAAAWLPATAINAAPMTVSVDNFILAFLRFQLSRSERRANLFV
jgi:hypothetical protein